MYPLFVHAFHTRKKSPEKKSPTQKLIVKFPFGTKKRSPKKLPKKSMMVRIPLKKQKTPDQENQDVSRSENKISTKENRNWPCKDLSGVPEPEIQGVSVRLWET
jgi:hypothetical protein